MFMQLVANITRHHTHRGESRGKQLSEPGTTPHTQNMDKLSP